MVLSTILVTLVILTLAVAGLGLRMLFVKNGEFRGSCATNNPMLKNEIGECTVCGSKPGETCKSEN